MSGKRRKGAKAKREHIKFRNPRKNKKGGRTSKQRGKNTYLKTWTPIKNKNSTIK